MKICPTCRRTYAEATLNFCLEDGTPLNVLGDAPPTMVMPQAPQTGDDARRHPGLQTSWDQKPTYSLQPKNQSRTWLWVVGVVGIGLLLCGAGVVGMIFLAAMGADNNQIANTGGANTSWNNRSVANSASDLKAEVETIDLSTWIRPNSGIGVTEYKDGEFLMASRRKGFYYVLVAEPQYRTDSAKTSVTLRNVDDAASALGYGLIFLSDPNPLRQGYAFLIDTRTKRYRVVRHEPQKEIDVVKWSSSPAIRPGSSENKLAVDHRGDQLDLYINDQKVTTIQNVHGYPNGVAGIYSGDAARVAFKNLEIRR